MSQRFVCNSSPLIAFERLNELSLLQKLTETVYIPEAVLQEVFGDRPLLSWIVAKPITQPLSFRFAYFLKDLENAVSYKDD